MFLAHLINIYTDGKPTPQLSGLLPLLTAGGAGSSVLQP